MRWDEKTGEFEVFRMKKIRRAVIPNVGIALRIETSAGDLGDGPDLQIGLTIREARNLAKELLHSAELAELGGPPSKAYYS